MKRFFLLLLVVGLTAQAGGPMTVDDVSLSGSPSRWPFRNGKWVLHWRADLGKLTPNIDNEEAIEEWVKPLFEKWKSVTLSDPDDRTKTINTVALEFVYDGTVNKDITADNYGEYIFHTVDQRPDTVIIFDIDGSLIEKFCLDDGKSEKECKSQRKGIAGLAGILNRDASTKRIQNGFIILNGILLDGISNDENPEMNSEQFKSVITHELGHLINLSHTQINFELSEECHEVDDFDCPTGQAIATMYPASLSYDQFTLHRDDKVMVSYIYPSDAFQENYCTVVGEIIDSEGKGVKGVNVLAKNVLDPVVDVRSGISGAYYPETADDGRYVLPGLMPETDYEISYEELTHLYDRGSGFPPLGPASPTGVGAGLIADEDGKTTIRCEKGGVKRMPDYTMDLKKGPDVDENPKEGKSGGGWFCSVNSGDPKSVLPFLLLLLVPYFFYKRKS